MAGVYAIREEWTRAVAYASQAVRRNSADTHAWRILAAGSFVTGDSSTALEAWNQIGEPVIDLVNVRGLEHTRHAAAAALMRLEPQTVLTSRALAAANRRLDEMPAAQTARVSYRPLENGRAAVDAVLIERPRAPTSLTSLAVIGARTLSEREVGGWITNPTGGGDLVTASWRWWENRPRVLVSYAAPAPFGGVMHAAVYRDVQTYEETANAEPRTMNAVREVRKGGGVLLSDWTGTNLRWEVGAGVDAWTDRGRTVVLSAGADQRLAARSCLAAVERECAGR